MDDSLSGKAEIELLDHEIGDRIAEDRMVALIAMVGLIRYAKCVLLDASTRRLESVAKFNFDDVAVVGLSVLADLQCPISLELMTDLIVVACGLTYDRESITCFPEHLVPLPRLQGLR